ncbi:hypothetical protein, partial [Saccharothrix sp. ST-888]|uniref:hypothetical protein n=1 Tax=Saccharothrix sp. ST-888 TaxID=1427391 RepID=UPI000A3E721F
YGTPVTTNAPVPDSKTLTANCRATAVPPSAEAAAWTQTPPPQLPAICAGNWLPFANSLRAAPTLGHHPARPAAELTLPGLKQLAATQAASK